MKKIYIVLLIMLNVVAYGSTVEERHSQAVEAYKSSDYTKTIAFYESILSEGNISSTVYYNLGNAYYKTGNIAKSILNYERALRLEPNKKEIIDNLEFVNAQRKDKIEGESNFILRNFGTKIINLFTSDGWAILAIILLSLALLLAIECYFGRILTLRKLSFIISTTFSVLFVLSIIFSFEQKSQQTNREYAIVVAPSVTAVSTPDENGTKLFVIHEGIKVKIKSELEPWVEIELPSGQIGWMKKVDLEQI